MATPAAGSEYGYPVLQWGDTLLNQLGGSSATVTPYDPTGYAARVMTTGYETVAPYLTPPASGQTKETSANASGSSGSSSGSSSIWSRLFSGWLWQPSGRGKGALDQTPAGANTGSAQWIPVVVGIVAAALLVVGVQALIKG